LIAPKQIGPAAKCVDLSLERTRESGRIVRRTSGAGGSTRVGPASGAAPAPRDPHVRAALEQLAEFLATQILAEIRGERSGTIAAGTASERRRALRP